MLVASAFLTEINGKKEVNHKDRNKLNNHVDNLEWCSRIENMNHVYGVNKRYGLTPRRGGWKACKKIDGKMIHLGDFKNKEEAYKVFYDFFKNCHGFYPWKAELNSWGY